MPRAVFATATLLLGGGLLWAARVTFGATPWSQAAAALLAADLVILTAVTVVAVLLAPGRWVRNLIAVLGAGWASLSLVLEIDALWVAAFGSSLAGVAIAWLGTLDSWFAGAIKPDRVPYRATILSIGLLATPGVLATAASPDVTPAGWVLAALALVAAWAYSRAMPVTLWALRITLPVIGVSVMIGLRIGAAIAIGVWLAALVALAWTPEARLAVSPIAPRKVDTVSILPEMVPTELMESAGYDRMGRRKPHGPERPGPKDPERKSTGPERPGPPNTDAGD